MIEFDQTPDVHFFLCRKCRAHIAFDEEHLLIVCSLSLSLSLCIDFCKLLRIIIVLFKVVRIGCLCY